MCALARRIEVVLDPECDKRYPDISKATITVVTKDGRTLRGEAYSYRDLSHDEIRNKFFKLTDSVLTPHQAQRIVSAIENLENVAAVKELVPLLVRASERRAAA